jgi:hypothetical protein
MSLTAQILLNILCNNHNGGTIISLDIIKTTITNYYDVMSSWPEPRDPQS